MKAIHESQLEQSGIEYEDWLGLESTEDGLRFDYLDIPSAKFQGDAMYRIRLDGVDEGKKYDQPKGTGCKLYFPPTFYLSPDDDQRVAAWNALNGKGRKPRDVVIVEGEKKALALQQELGPKTVVVGLGGVQNWGKRDFDKERGLLDEWEWINRLQDRKVYICFDSDVVENPQVELAEHQLSKSLKQEFRAWVSLLTIEHEQGAKQGIDDVIYRYGDNFQRVWKKMIADAVPFRASLPKPLSGRQLVTTEWDMDSPIVWSKEGGEVNILTESGTGFVHAGTGVGKTYFLLQLAACITAGERFLGFDTEQHKVMFLQQELSNGWFARRVRVLRRTFGEAVDDIKFISGDFSLASQDRFKNAKLELTKLERLINQSGTEVVMLDPLQGYYDMSESSIDHSREFMKAIVKVAKNTGACIIMSHHDRKDDTGPSISQMRGGSPFSDLTDTVLGIKRKPLMERNMEYGNMHRVKDDYGQQVFHPTDLILKFDKVRHSEGPIPPDALLGRLEEFDDGMYNPFFEHLGNNVAS